MVLVDVNILIGAKMSGLPFHAQAKAWLDALLQSDRPVRLPWAVLVAFVRITTNPRAMTNPLSMNEALEQVVEWLGLPGVTVLHPTPEHARHFTEQCRVANATGNLVSDAHLAALALEHDCELASNDADFAKFPTVRWVNPMVLQGN